VLERIVPPHGFAALEIAGQTVAAGLAVVERGNVGLFDIVVDPGVRNRGLGRRLCTSLLAWARTWHAAHIAYLAVMQDNAPARSLYARLGFGEVYTYWYRQRRGHRGDRLTEEELSANAKATSHITASGTRGDGGTVARPPEMSKTGPVLKHSVVLPIATELDARRGPPGIAAQQAVRREIPGLAA
jgi:N-acetylglutamate synthase-like GNAT family acetyltransferase